MEGIAIALAWTGHELFEKCDHFKAVSVPASSSAEGQQGLQQSERVRRPSYAAVLCQALPLVP